MSQTMWIYEVSPGAVFAAAFGILFGFALLGFAAGARVKKRHPEIPDLQEFVPSTIMGLLALILAFTFSLAISRFEDRLRLGVEEANAIGTANLRSKLLRLGRGEEISAHLKRYVGMRIDYYKALNDNRKLTELESALSRYQKLIWVDAVRATRDDRGPIEAIFIESLNSMFDLEKSRDIALAKTVPRAIYWVILLIAATGMCTLNFRRGQRAERGQGQIAILALMFTVPYVLILDLDRPTSGAIRISQDAMIALYESFDQP